MKRFPTELLLLVSFAVMLFSPAAVFQGASDGLLLWFQILFPTLFPFLVITALLLHSGGLELFARTVARPVGRIFSVSSNGAFAVIAGFLCGYPMGAKVTADLVRSGKISKQEGAYLLSFCNNTSPAFLVNFLVGNALKEEKLLVPTLVILIGTPVLLSFVFRKFYGQISTVSDSIQADHSRFPKKEPLLRFYIRKDKRNFLINKTYLQKSNFVDHKIPFISLVDSCIMNSFEAITKVGGYLILFSILIALLDLLPLPATFHLLAAAPLEVTNGILLLCRSSIDLTITYPAVIGLTSFSGWCAVAQTNCMLRDTGLSIFPYIIQKLTAAMAASLLAYIYVRFV